MDRKFPPCPSSVGNVGGDSADLNAGQTDLDIVWVRASAFSTVKGEGEARPSMLSRIMGSKLSDSKMVLYEDGISANDIMQGRMIIGSGAMRTFFPLWLKSDAMPAIFGRGGGLDDEGKSVHCRHAVT